MQKCSQRLQYKAESHISGKIIHHDPLTSRRVVKVKHHPDHRSSLFIPRPAFARLTPYHFINRTIPYLRHPHLGARVYFGAGGSLSKVSRYNALFLESLVADSDRTIYYVDNQLKYHHIAATTSALSIMSPEASPDTSSRSTASTESASTTKPAHAPKEARKELDRAKMPPPPLPITNGHSPAP